MLETFISLNAFLYSSNYSVYCFTKTWLNVSIKDYEVISEGFILYCKDRSNRGGGALGKVEHCIARIDLIGEVVH